MVNTFLDFFKKCAVFSTIFGLLVSAVTTVKEYGDDINMALTENQGFSAIRLDKIIDSVNARISIGEIAGASVLVARNGKIVYCEQSGCSNADTGAQIQYDSLFRLASMSKPITAAAVLIQCDRGLLSLDDPVSKYIPELSDMSIAVMDGDKIVSSVKATVPMTIRHLLTHSSGLGSGESFVAQPSHLASASDTLADFIPTFGNTLLDFEPGTRSAYSALYGFDTLARIVELTSGQTFDVFLQKNLFEPLDMKDSCFNPSEEQSKRVVSAHAGIEGKLIPVDNIDAYIGGFPTNYFSGGAGMISTIGDYYNFATMLLNGGSFNGKQVISEKLIKEMQTPQLSTKVPGVSRSFNWGLGVRVIPSIDNTLPKGSFGWSGAWGTHFWVDPKHNITALYFMNMTTIGGAGAPTANEFERNVMNALIF